MKLPTIFTKTVVPLSHEPGDLETARRQGSNAMARYFLSLRRKAGVSDSMVRKWIILSKRTCVLEQTVTVEIGRSRDSASCRAVVWLDAGKELADSIEGPWSHTPETNAWKTFFHPVIVPQATDLPNTSQTLFKAESFSSRSSKRPNTSSPALIVESASWKAGQNISHLPFKYGAHLNRELASRDVLYALSELLHFVAAAEIQFFNVLQKCIDKELSFVGAPEIGESHSVSLLNLRYIKMQLSSHSQSLAEVANLLRNRTSLDWPRMTKDEDQSLADIAEKTAALQLTDFEYLLQRTLTLAHECEQGMTTLADS
ncbi:hypothetical protein CORC01_07118 [Colletotrichum orchidophilum]|uniref:Uncharacterized protein n=1 Tax=Colletotrichum orchidophilum TaxID=1209926 RepID=A0A1G4B872_9PEZI|nr:uncharacterized protein CORC01_07118 [Colletotrichum orchidophilum]OHE97503.1 hypothetical protein CORC01_07118 [Colletotrichum orchidophilum]